MTLEEAIIHAESEAWKNEREADRCSRHGGSAYEEKSKACNACANEHRQLAEWLKELKAYRETYPYGVDQFNGSDTPQTEQAERIPYDPLVEADIKRMVEERLRQTDCCETCKHNKDGWDSEACDPCSRSNSNYEPQTDCGWK